MTEAGKGTSLRKRIFRAGLAVGAAHLLFKFAGLIQAQAMGRCLEKGTFDVVYAFAFENCIFSLFLIGEEVIGPAFLPVFMRECGDGPEGDKKAWSFAGAFFTLQLTVLLAVVAALVFFPELPVRLLTKWSPDNKPEAFLLAAQSVRHLAPALIGLSLGSTTYVILNSYKRFFLAAFGDAVWKLSVVAALMLFAAKAADAASVLIWGLVAGSVLKFLSHLWGLRDKLRNFRPSFKWNSPALRSMALLALPLLAGIIFAKFRDIFNNVYVLTALDADGLMQANSMGRKLQSVLHWIIPYTLSIAVFPFFCEMADKGDREGLGEFITRSGRQLLAIFVPFAALTAVISVPLTEIVFGGGNFDAVSVRRTALSMSCYNFVLPAAAIEAIIMQAFFAAKRTLAVSVAGIVFSSVSILISLIGLHYFRDNGFVLLGIIAGGFAISRWMKTASLIVLFRKSAPAFPFRPTLLFLAKLILASALADAAGYAVTAPVTALTAKFLHVGKLAALAQIALCGGCGLVVLLAAYKLVGITEPFDLVKAAISARKKNK